MIETNPDKQKGTLVDFLPSFPETADTQYRNMMEKVMLHGHDDIDRTGTGKRSIFSHEMRFNLRRGFPLITRKKTFMRNVISELIWFLRGDTNIQYLTDHKNPIWNEWADENGDLGPVYGAQWRGWKRYTVERAEEVINHLDGKTKTHIGAKVKVEEIDQIQRVIDTLKTNPESRRIIVSGWNVADLEDMALPPCHSFFQFWTRNLNDTERVALLTEKLGSLGILDRIEPLENRRENLVAACDEHNIPRKALSCKLTQRSADTFLGVPFNIASYALLTHMIAQCVNMMPEEFIWSGGDVHVYHNHFEQVRQFLDLPEYDAPTLVIKNGTTNINDFKPEDFEIVGYQCGPYIPAPVAV